MKILLIAPYYDSRAVGESWSTFKWVEGISRHHEVTVLTMHPESWRPEESPLPSAEIVNWTSPKIPKRLAALDRGVKLTYIAFYRNARRWIKDHLKKGGRFDLIHQISPLGLRYPSPAAGLGIPFVIGPLAGSLPTPEGFRKEMHREPWYVKLRNLDAFRLRRDPWLRKTYREAAAVIGVAPYVKELMRGIPLKRFEIMGETGMDQTGGGASEAPREDGPLKLVFVGRIIRTKGIIDGIRAFAIAARTCGIELDVAGEGDLLGACKEEAARLGVEKSIRFHGRVTREEVFKLYRNADVFLFPSYREPSGNVVFEALSFGLPVITSTCGGPGHVITDECGIRIEPRSPDAYARDLAGAIENLATHREQLHAMSQAARRRLQEVGLWQTKIERLMELYEEVALPHSARA